MYQAGNTENEIKIEIDKQIARLRLRLRTASFQEINKFFTNHASFLKLIPFHKNHAGFL